MDDDLPPRPRGDAVSRLAAEDLAPLSLTELDGRIAALRAEIARVEAHRDDASRHRAVADALFKPRS